MAKNRHEREALIEQDGGDPDENVFVNQEYSSPKAYHSKRACVQIRARSSDLDVQPITRREAHKRLWYPCTRCFDIDQPEVERK